MKLLLRPALFVVLAALMGGEIQGTSFYTALPNDPSAVVLSKESVPNLHGDGVGDDTAAIQEAIDKVASTSVGKGVVLVAEGRYRISKTIHILPGVRVLGYGAHRPVLVLGPNTPGFQEGDRQLMVWFVGGRDRNGGYYEASPSTFYSALANVDFEIQDGNPAAIGIRAYYAQHCYLAHIDFHIGSGRAGIGQAGNEAEDLHFYGGDYGIITLRPTPSWQFTLLDATFEGQRKAAIKSQEAGLTLIRNRFKHVPTAIAIDDDHAEELWLKDSRLEDISGPALIISDEKSAQTEINLENVVCQRTPTLAAFRESGKTVAGVGDLYRVKEFTHGLHIAEIGAQGSIKTSRVIETLASAPSTVASDIPCLPPVESWTSIKQFGAKGDGQADDLPAFKEAISKAKVIFLPAGVYRVSDSVKLAADTILIGLNPITTQIAIQDGEAAFAGSGAYAGVVESAPGGNNIVQGIGIDSGAGNSRAVGLKWTAGVQSMVNDVKFLGGHGTYYSGLPRLAQRESRQSNNGNNRKWDSDGPSLLVTQNGGGTFANIWSANTFASYGLSVENTTNAGRIYELSCEHHVRKEVLMRNVAHWQVYALQTEEEWNESPNCLALDVQDSRDITFANLYMFRVVGMSSPFLCGASLSASRDLRFRNVHVYSQSKFSFDNAIYDQSCGIGIRSREIGRLDVSGAGVKGQASRSKHKVESAVGGFNSIDSLVSDSLGNIYFVDARWHNIYRYSPETRGLTLLSDDRLDAAALGMDKSDHLLIISRSGKIFALDTTHAGAEAISLEPVPAAERPGMMAVVPNNRWYDWHTFLDDNQRKLPTHVVSPDKSVFIPVPENFLRNNGRGMTFPPIDLLRAYQITLGDATHPVYVADEFMHKTWKFNVGLDGTLSEPRLFAEEGEVGSAVDGKGNVYIAAGNIFVYNASGKQIGLIEIPERPTGLVFGGKDHRTLYVGARGSLYRIER